MNNDVWIGCNRISSMKDVDGILKHDFNNQKCGLETQGGFRQQLWGFLDGDHPGWKCVPRCGMRWNTLSSGDNYWNPLELAIPIHFLSQSFNLWKINIEKFDEIWSATCICFSKIKQSDAAEDGVCQPRLTGIGRAHDRWGLSGSWPQSLS